MPVQSFSPNFKFLGKCAELDSSYSSEDKRYFAQAQRHAEKWLAIFDFKKRPDGLNF